MTSKLTCGVSICGAFVMMSSFWMAAIGLMIAITVMLSDHGALIDNTCFQSKVLFKQADYFILDTVDYRPDFTWVSNTSVIEEVYEYKNYKDWTIVSGAVFPLFGIASFVRYPSGICIDYDTEYRVMSMVIVILWAVGWGISLCCFGLFRIFFKNFKNSGGSDTEFFSSPFHY